MPASLHAFHCDFYISTTKELPQAGLVQYTFQLLDHSPYVLKLVHKLKRSGNDAVQLIQHIVSVALEVAGDTREAEHAAMH